MRKKCLSIFNNFIKNIFTNLIKIIDDIIMIIGISLLCRGVFLIYVPAGYIILGICLVALAFFIARKKVIADAYSKFNE